jgi:hypothetical protein
MIGADVAGGAHPNLAVLDLELPPRLAIACNAARGVTLSKASGGSGVAPVALICAGAEASEQIFFAISPRLIPAVLLEERLIFGGFCSLSKIKSTPVNLAM